MKLFYEKYIKLAHIGKGANAHVYKVKHAELGYIRAIKILNDYIESKGDRTYQSFLKECKTLLAIGNGSHPNIVRIYGPDLIDNHAVVEMDYVQGMTLDSYIKEKGALEYNEVQKFIHDIVGALAYTHHDIYKFLMRPEEDNLQPDPVDGRKYLISPEKETELVKSYGIAHNDLHSNNVMRRDYDGSFVILDFGLAVQDGECVKSSRKSDGSPEYKAPEKFDSGDVTPRSDIYSLGVLMYEVLTGRPPFVLETGPDGKISYPAIDKICQEHHTVTPPPILPLRKRAFESRNPGTTYERDYPEWLDEVIMKCLAKRPEDRYADARELLDDIHSHVNGAKGDSHVSLSKKYKELEKRLDNVNDKYLRVSSELDNAKKENDFLRKGISPASAAKVKKWHAIAGIAIFLMLASIGFAIYSLSISIQDSGRDYSSMDSKGDSITTYKGGDELTEQMQAENDSLSRVIKGLLEKKASDGSVKVVYQNIPETEEELKSLKGMCQDLKSENASLKEQMNSLKNQKPAPAGKYSDAAGDALTNKLNQAEKKINSLQKELASAKSALAAKQAAQKTVTKIEYKTPPEVEKELKRLRSRVQQLEKTVRIYEQNL